MEVLVTSQEVQAAKNIRKTTKGALTRIANQLKRDLVLEPGNKYDFAKLDKFSISADANRLEKKLEELYQQNEAYVKQAKRIELMGELLRSKGFIWLATSNLFIGGWQQAGNILKIALIGTLVNI